MDLKTVSPLQTPPSQEKDSEEVVSILLRLLVRGDIDPVIGRDEEIRVIGNPQPSNQEQLVLIGEPGVASSCCSWAPAQKIVRRYDVPINLRQEVIRLDVVGLNC